MLIFKHLFFLSVRAFSLFCLPGKDMQMNLYDPDLLTPDPALTYDEFKEALKASICLADPEGDLEFLEHNITKTNENCIEALSILKSGRKVNPTVYPEKLYSSYLAGVPMDMIAERIIHVEIPKEAEIDPLVQDPKEHIFFALLNAARNRFLLSSCPHIILGDIAAIPFWHYSEGLNSYVTYALTKQLGLSADEVLSIASENTEAQNFTVLHISEHLNHICPAIAPDFEEAESKIPIYVLTNESHERGASAILSERTLRKAAARIGSDFYLLPSSRHEFLAVGVEHGKEEELQRMVQEVNENVLSSDEFLSDSLYFCDTRTYEVRML